MLKRMGTTVLCIAAVAVIVIPAVSAGNTSRLSGSISGPYSTVSGFAPVAPSLGSHLTFDVAYSGFKGQVAPYVYAACYQNGVLAYGELKPVSGGAADFPKFGYDSQWSLTGGAADCTAWLVAYGGLTHGGTIAWLDSVPFTASG